MIDDITTLNPPEVSNGWTLTTAKPYCLIWTSPSDYGIKVELPEASVTALLPPIQIDTSSGQPSLQEHKTLHPGTADAEEAIDIAVSWLKKHSVEVEDVVRDLPGVGDRTADYLALRHDATTLRTVRSVFGNDELQAIVQERFHDDLRAQLVGDQYGE